MGWHRSVGGQRLAVFLGFDNLFYDLTAAPARPPNAGEWPPEWPSKSSEKASKLRSRPAKRFRAGRIVRQSVRMSKNAKPPQSETVPAADKEMDPEEPLQILSERVGREWTSVGEKTDAAEKPLKELRALLCDALTSENLVVLTGLGTSRCIQGAPSMDDLWDAMKAAAGESAFQDICTKARYEWDGGRGNFEILLSRCVLHSRVNPSDKAFTEFLTKAESTIVEKCRFVTEGQELPIHEEFLRKISRRPTTKARTKVFTTNYDLAFETAAGRLGFAVIDGFSHTLPQQFDGEFFNIDYVRRPRTGEAPEFVEKVFHLYKLHGSVDWERQTSEMVRNPNAKQAVIIYPAENKFETSYQQPFLEVMGCFQTALRTPNTGLLIAGFGFNDAHLVQPILASVRANAALKVVILALNLRRTCSDEERGNPSLQVLETLAKRGDQRITLIDGKFDHLVRLIPDLVAATAEERQRALLKSVLDKAAR
jgi:hypothetical protein